MDSTLLSTLDRPRHRSSCVPVRILYRLERSFHLHSQHLSKVRGFIIRRKRRSA
jgi:hypothetical protein